MPTSATLTLHALHYCIKTISNVEIDLETCVEIICKAVKITNFSYRFKRKKNHSKIHFLRIR